jgi:hypothetical protein
VPLFKVHCSDGSETDVRAQRVAQAHDLTGFDQRTGDTWLILFTVPNDEVVEVEKQVVTPTGKQHWTKAQPVPMN